MTKKLVSKARPPVERPVVEIMGSKGPLGQVPERITIRTLSGEVRVLTDDGLAAKVVVYPETGLVYVNHRDGRKTTYLNVPTELEW